MKHILKADEKFGNWTLIRCVRSDYWLCRCICGVERAVYKYSLTKGKSRGCNVCGGKRGHPPRDVLARFYDKIIVDIRTGCWNFDSPPSKTGYGRFKLDGKSRDAYVVAHELFIGPVPKGKELHHVCENRKCVRQDSEHVTPVTRREHLVNLSPTNTVYKNARKTHCPKGHPLVAGNLLRWLWRKRRIRVCRRCHNDMSIECNRARLKRLALANH